VVLLGAEQQTNRYSTGHQAVADGAVARGWLPEFLPVNVTNLVERHDLDSNAGAFAFRASVDDLERFQSELELVPVARWAAIGPRLTGPTDVWPRALVAGNLANFASKQDFKNCQKAQKGVDAVSVIWYFAINPAKGQAFGWHQAERIDLRPQENRGIR